MAAEAAVIFQQRRHVKEVIRLQSSRGVTAEAVNFFAEIEIKDVRNRFGCFVVRRKCRLVGVKDWVVFLVKVITCIRLQQMGVDIKDGIQRLKVY